MARCVRHGRLRLPGPTLPGCRKQHTHRSYRPEPTRFVDGALDRVTSVETIAALLRRNLTRVTKSGQSSAPAPHITMKPRFWGRDLLVLAGTETGRPASYHGRQCSDCGGHAPGVRRRHRGSHRRQRELVLAAASRGVRGAVRRFITTPAGGRSPTAPEKRQTSSRWARRRGAA
jgi:hypothetical protein